VAIEFHDPKRDEVRAADNSRRQTVYGMSFVVAVKMKTRQYGAAYKPEHRKVKGTALGRKPPALALS